MIQQRNTQSLRGRDGYTLVEMLVVISALGVLMGALILTLFGTLRIETGSRESLDRLVMDATLADQFRDDVGQAVAAPARWHTYLASPGCLILKRSENRHIVYEWQKNQVVRSEFRAGGKTTRRQLTVKGKANVIFSRPAGAPRLFTLQIARSPGRHGNDTVLEFAAALGGQRQ